jgi:hypothetical protein
MRRPPPRVFERVRRRAHAAVHWKNYPLAQRGKRRRQEIEAWLGARSREERAFVLHCLTPFELRINCPDGTAVALRVYPRQTVRALKQAIATVRRGIVSGRRVASRCSWFVHSAF